MCFVGVIATLFVCALFGMCRVCVFVCFFFFFSRHYLHWLNVVCWNVDGFGGLFRWGFVHGAGRQHGCEAVFAPPRYV
jgi:hypothetical protein